MAAPLEGKVAIVTGGGRGLGRSMALGLARAGATVIATAARERQELERVAAQAPPDSVTPMMADVTDAQSCAALVGETLTGRSSWRAAAPAMIEAGWGRIINTSMSFSTMQRRGVSPYGPSKAALESETQIWAQDLAGTGVTVNANLPGGAPSRQRGLGRNHRQALRREQVARGSAGVTRLKEHRERRALDEDDCLRIENGRVTARIAVCPFPQCRLVDQPLTERAPEQRESVVL
jgi:NAD(P)-dependent dehydrogenase (short-subunit alcohol dehydrogenase family)